MGISRFRNRYDRSLSKRLQPLISGRRRSARQRATDNGQTEGNSRSRLMISRYTHDSRKANLIIDATRKLNVPRVSDLFFNYSGHRRSRNQVNTQSIINGSDISNVGSNARTYVIREWFSQSKNSRVCSWRLTPSRSFLSFKLQSIFDFHFPARRILSSISSFSVLLTAFE